MASVNKVIVVGLYVDAQQSIPDISRSTGINRSAVRKALLDAGVQMRTRAEGIRVARAKLGLHLKGKTRVFTDEWRRNLAAAKQLRADSTAIGVSHKTGGYSEFTRGPNKGRGVHVVLKEQEIGRRLLPHEVVHHKDEDKQNNELSNLVLMTRSDHARHHRIEAIQRSNHGQR